MKEFDFDNKPIVDIANEVILDAVKRGASDIHFDPYEEDLIIRIRVDGVLYDYAKVPPSHKRNMISRIKMIASMNIMETRLPQDGAIKSRIGGRDIDLRVSSLPTYNGEKVVLRILDYTRSLQGLESLGFSEHNYDKIIKMTEIPNGIILVTGATGSGKSTTVYSVLQKLNTRDVNIITVEDPVEMDIAGLNQVQAQEEIGLDFATVLRSILRQDPDIIMIGEIRDTETARIAVRASITGHKVLSTIHTNNALNTIERLTDMDVERYLIGTSLNGVVSQKLARKLCPHCRILRETNDYEKSLFRKVLHEEVNKIYDINPDGCDKCFKGYKDRTAIAEVLVITDAIRTAITTSAPKDEMRKLVYIDGQTRTLLEDGLEKIKDGDTTFQELYKLVDMENDLAIHEKFEEDFIKRNKEIKKQQSEKPKKEEHEEVKEEIKEEVKEKDNEKGVVIEETPVLDLNNMNNKPEIKEEPKDEDKVEVSDETNEEPKDEAKVEVLDETKEEPKDEAKVEVLDETKKEPKLEILNEPTEKTLDEPKDESKEDEIITIEEPKLDILEEITEKPIEETQEEPVIEVKEDSKKEEQPETLDLNNDEVDQEFSNDELLNVPFVDETIDL